jgi:hypothetical protein
MAKVYSLVRGYEAGDWDIVTTLADRLGMPAAAVGTAYVESAHWAAEVSGMGSHRPPGSSVWSPG